MIRIISDDCNVIEAEKARDLRLGHSPRPEVSEAPHQVVKKDRIQNGTEYVSLEGLLVVREPRRSHLSDYYRGIVRVGKGRDGPGPYCYVYCFQLPEASWVCYYPCRTLGTVILSAVRRVLARPRCAGHGICLFEKQSRSRG